MFSFFHTHSFLFTCILTISSLSFPGYASQLNVHDAYIKTMASLSCCLCSLQEAAQNDEAAREDSIPFSTEDVHRLWIEAEKIPSDFTSIERCVIQDARTHYLQYTDYRQMGLSEEASHCLSQSTETVLSLWEKAIEEEGLSTSSTDVGDAILRLKKYEDPNVEHNRHLSKKIKKKVFPYLLPVSHPVRPLLDRLCRRNRVTSDESTFEHAGFHTLAIGIRSYIRVASHPQMPNHLVKVYLDTVLNKKYGKPSWEWLVLRCEGAEKLKNVIKKKKIKHFTVARKWIYCLPEHPSPPKDELHTRHLALLVVTDMNLVSDGHNYHAWKHYITHEHLDELYAIISRARGSSYRPDNIAYTKKENFAFIDTEYPSKGPDFMSIRPYLNHEMRDYWDTIITNGGAHGNP